MPWAAHIFDVRLKLFVDKLGKCGEGGAGPSFIECTLSAWSDRKQTSLCKRLGLRKATHYE